MAIDRNKKDNFYVYRYIRLDTNTPFYVGKGRGQRAYDNKTSRNKHFKSIVTKHGARVELVVQNVTEENALSFESRLIKLYKSYGYCESNYTIGGDGNKSLDEFCKHRSERMRGKLVGPKNPMYGKTTSAKQKETARKIRQELNRNRTQEETLRIVEKIATKVLDLKTGILYKSIIVAAKLNNINKQTLRDRLMGKCSNPTTLVVYKSEMQHKVKEICPFIRVDKTGVLI